MSLKTAVLHGGLHRNAVRLEMHKKLYLDKVIGRPTEIPDIYLELVIKFYKKKAVLKFRTIVYSAELNRAQ